MSKYMSKLPTQSVKVLDFSPYLFNFNPDILKSEILVPIFKTKG